MQKAFKKRLLSLADPQYQQFSAKLLPGLSTPLLGVRLPHLRRLAKELARKHGAQALSLLTDETFEELMLQGMVIGELKEGPESVFPLVKQFVPKINCWSVCDSFCTTLKIAPRFPQETWALLVPYFKDTREYYFRFAAVTALVHFAKGPYAKELFALLNNCPSNGFYAKMAVAWAISVLCVHNPPETLAFLKQDALDDFTHNKAIQKIGESFRVPADIKTAAKALKRPLN